MIGNEVEGEDKAEQAQRRKFLTSAALLFEALPRNMTPWGTQAHHALGSYCICIRCGSSAAIPVQDGGLVAADRSMGYGKPVRIYLTGSAQLILAADVLELAQPIAEDSTVKGHRWYRIGQAHFE
jgi:hypothetical protein